MIRALRAPWTPKKSLVQKTPSVRRTTLVVVIVAGVMVCCGTGEAGELKLELAGDGKPVFVKSGEIAGLSGVTWCGGDSFAAVSDREPVVVPLTLKIGPTGVLEKAAAGVPVRLATRLSDCEGIAWVVGEGRFYVSAEGGPGIQGFGRADGKAGPVLKLPEVFGQARGNLSLESLTFESTAGRFWTANEEALTVDGPVAGTKEGTLVRLQEISKEGRMLRQVAWRTECAGMRFQGAGNGVVDLCLLPGGQLLVLERGFGSGGLHARVFLADLAGATETGSMETLAGEAIKVAGKTLLMDLPSGFTNYEGMCTGPVLADGSRSLIFVADSGGPGRHAFLALRLSGLSGGR